MKERFRRFMSGRYGNDDLGRAINILALILLVLGTLLLPQLSAVAILLMVIYFFRVFSRNVYKRAQENTKYLTLRRKVKSWFSICVRRIKERKTHRYFRCPSCHQTLRVPKGRGKIAITCPKCHTVFTKRS